MGNALQKYHITFLSPPFYQEVSSKWVAINDFIAMSTEKYMIFPLISNDKLNEQSKNHDILSTISSCCQCQYYTFNRNMCNNHSNKIINLWQSFKTEDIKFNKIVAMAAVPTRSKLPKMINTSININRDCPYHTIPSIDCECTWSVRSLLIISHASRVITRNTWNPSTQQQWLHRKDLCAFKLGHCCR